MGGYCTSDFDYRLPEELIAQHPSERRGDSRMLVLDRRSGAIEHHHFRELPDFLRPGDLAVLNNSKVVRARVRTDDGRVEVFFLESAGPLRWRCLVKPGRKMRVGRVVAIGGVGVTVESVLPTGERNLVLEREIDLERYGAVPLPPYIDREPESGDSERYQTVYAKPPGSVAAPTAGLHFTPEVLRKVPHAFVTLHVGTGTFLPVKTEVLSEHRMHSEPFEIGVEAARAINSADRLLAVGTTAARVLESLPPGPVRAMGGRTELFIHAPYEFERIGMLLTNFHLPKSSLLMLACAFGGHEAVLEAYRQAIAARYRFYSYGDCMLIF